MDPRQLAFTNALAAVFAVTFYAATLALFAIFDSSEYGRIERAGLRLELIYFGLYFIYFGLYLGIAIAFTRQTSVLIRTALGTAVAVFAVPFAVSAFYLGYLLGAVLFVVGGIFGRGPSAGLIIAMLAIPATGLGAGYVFNVVLTHAAGWPRAAATEIRRRNVVTAAACACIAAYFAYSHGMGHEPLLGQARIFEQMFAGLIGPAIHVAGAVALAIGSRQGGTRPPLDPRAIKAATAMAVIMLVVLLAQVAMTHVRSNGQLWTASGLARVFAKPETVRQQRRPPDQPIRIAEHVVDVRPIALKESSYDWQTERFLHANFRLGTADVAGRPIEVMLDLTKAWQRGLGYVCDEPIEGVLLPCQVADFNNDLKNDSRIIRVGLYQGESQIGRIGRSFLMSCRYSFGICKIEFVQPWYEGLRVALIFDQQERQHWADIVRYAIPEIERLIKRVP